MIIKLKTSKLITIIYVLSFFVALAQLRYQLLYESNPTLWYKMYNYSIYLMEFLCVVILLMYSLKRRKLNKFTFMLIGFVLYEFVVSILSDGTVHLEAMIIDILLWPLLWAVFYEYFLRNDFPKYFHIITVVGLSLLCIFSIPNIERHLLDYGRAGGVIFPLYFTIGYLSLMLLNDSKKIKTFYLIVIVALLLISTKRTGALAVIGGIVLYYIVEAHCSSTLKEKITKYRHYILIGVLLFAIGAYLIQHNNLAIFDRFNSISEDNGSGRIYIWADIINHFNSSSIPQKIFGHGFHAVYYHLKPHGLNGMAHNSFLETLYDYGIFGLTYLFFIIFQLLMYFRKMLHHKFKYASIIAFSIPSMLLIAILSYFFEQSEIIIPFAVAWGIVMGKYDANRYAIRRI